MPYELKTIKVTLLFIISVVLAVSNNSCKPRNIESNVNLNSVDTLEAFFIEFYNNGYDDTILERFKMKVIRSFKVDTAYFEYTNALDSFYEQTAKVPGENNPLINTNRAEKDQWFKLTDSFDLKIANKQTRLYKYKLMNADIDGSRTRILSRDLGLIGESHTDWGNGFIIRKFGEIEIDTATINYLLDRNNRIFRD